ncbi:MAG: molybdate ABC transporter substrate-binding protein [Gammaproteobacteria bacterium]|nr:molybdate ABC transporter substrate-binding protein [Gammaproteobacteria bacterium]
MKKLAFLILIFLLPDVHAGEVRVAVAANFLATLKALAPEYEAQSGHKLIISGASSGKLYAHILNGAPYDVLLSADKFYPEKLVEVDKAVANSRFTYAVGRLVLWSRDKQPIDRARLSDPDIKRIAIANTRTAPYGTAAQHVLQKIGLWSTLKDKLVRGESIGQTFQFVASGNAQLGFIALSQVLNPKNHFNRTSYWLVPQDHYPLLEQEAVLLTYGKNNPNARNFLEFLKSDVVRDAIRQYGYL